MYENIYRSAAITALTQSTIKQSIYTAAKRFFDIAIGVLGLMASAPIMALVCLALCCEGSGPVVFRQRRTGLYGRKFYIHKFRTMNVLEEGECAVQCKTSDARVTRVGRILRKLSLDELPQILNVVAGDMSLVGPRPHPPALDREFAARVPGYMSRYQVKPGVTGLAQVLGYRGPTSAPGLMEYRVKADLEYVRRQSFLLDLLILLKTLPAVFTLKNAF